MSAAQDFEAALVASEAAVLASSKTFAAALAAALSDIACCHKVPMTPGASITTFPPPKVKFK